MVNTNKKRRQRAARNHRYRANHPLTLEQKQRQAKSSAAYRAKLSAGAKRYNTVRGDNRRIDVGPSRRTKELNRVRTAAGRLVDWMNGGYLRVPLTLAQFLQHIQAPGHRQVRDDSFNAAHPYGPTMVARMVIHDRGVAAFLRGGEELQRHLDETAGRDDAEAEVDDELKAPIEDVDQPDADDEEPYAVGEVDADSDLDSDFDDAPPGGAAGVLIAV